MIRNNNQRTYHTPVLLKEIVEGLQLRPGKKYIDATLGGGGHTQALVKGGANVLAVDWDQDAIDYAIQKFRTPSTIMQRKLEINRNVLLAKGNFADLKKIAAENKFDHVDGILFDLGISSHQLDAHERGFSFQKDALLDMRMDREKKSAAGDIINNSSKEELYEIFTKFAEEINSRAIAESIIRARALEPIRTTSDLVKVVEKVKGKYNRINPATRVFQALRIAVNNELENLELGLDASIQLLKVRGRLAVISYHSLEDRKAKLFARKKNVRPVNKKPIRPEYKEIQTNPRARSAKLRIFERI